MGNVDSNPSVFASTRTTLALCPDAKQLATPTSPDGPPATPAARRLRRHPARRESPRDGPGIARRGIDARQHSVAGVADPAPRVAEQAMRDPHVASRDDHEVRSGTDLHDLRWLQRLRIETDEAG